MIRHLWNRWVLGRRYFVATDIGAPTLLCYIDRKGRVHVVERIPEEE